MWHLFLKIFIVLILLITGDNSDILLNDNLKIIKKNLAAPVMELPAEKAAVLAGDDRVWFFTKRADEVQPIASITKLMTALIFLENNPGWETTYVIAYDDLIEGGKLNLFRGEEIKLKDIFNTSLIASDNGATIALVHATGLSEEEFVKKMNEKARTLGLIHTQFKDPIGLSDENLSTAREVALLAKETLKVPEIREATKSKDYKFATLAGRQKKIESTDYLLFDPADNQFTVLGGKTGYTDKAGYCYVGWFADLNGREIISVILNSAGKNDRFRESKSLIKWVFDNYTW
jgi:D-alanyl-D-alanine carboxypeptidase